MSWVYRRPSWPQQRRKLTPSLFSSASAAQEITPSLVSQLLAGVEPAITTGNVNLSPSLVSQLLAGVDPTLTTGNVNLSPSLVSQLLAGVDPAITTGNVNLSPSLVSQLLAGVAPTITTGNVNLTPSLVSQLLAGVAPAITTGNVNLSPSLVSQLLAGVAPLVTGGSTFSIDTGFDIARFYRHNISGDQRLVLVVGLPRSVGKGFRADESWDTVSGHFALPVIPRHPVAKKDATDFVFSAWDANKNASQATLTTAINSALTNAGYTRPNGVAIT